MSTIIDTNVVFEEKGKLYFNKMDGKKVVARVTPEDMGYSKSIKAQIYIAKKISNDESLTDETIVFTQEIEYSIPSEVKYATAFLFQTRSKRIFLKWFDSGCTSEVGVNDGEFCHRNAKAVKLPNDTLLPKSTPIYSLNPKTGELELEVHVNSIFEA